MAKTSKNKRKAPTSFDVARLAGVSQAAVSVVLRNKEDGNIGVSEPVRRKIIDAVERLDYRPNRSARFMRLQRSNTIGFISSNYVAETGKIGNFGIHPFIVGLNRSLIDSDFHVVLLELGELETGSDKLPRALQERFFDGLVVHMGLSYDALSMIWSSGLPTIFFDSGVFEPERCFYRDERGVGRAATEMLLDRGHERIAFYHLGRHWELLNRSTEAFTHFSHRQRIEGFEQAVRDRGFEPLHLVNDAGADGLVAQLEKLQPTAIVIVGGDRIPGPLIQALIKARLPVPEKMSIASCDLEKILMTEEFETGGVTYDRFEAGRTAAEGILQLILDPNSKVPSQVLPIETRVGDTIARAPGD